jgi:hydrogenase maturation protease
MNTKAVDAIANAVLYEGYMLYPYRPSSVKNRQRFNFGVLYPKTYSDAQSGTDAWSMHTECLVESNSEANAESTFGSAIEVRIRFLKMVNRSVWKRVETDIQAKNDSEPSAYEAVPMLEVNGRSFSPWQEAIECEVNIPASDLEKLTTTPVRWNFDFPGKEESEILRRRSDAPTEDGPIVGEIRRTQEQVAGVIEIDALRVAVGIFKIRVSVKNVTAFQISSGDSVRHTERDRVLAQSMVSAHTVLGVTGGKFVSLLEPPDNLRELAGSCHNAGSWPVLVGREGDRSAMLASPIILYDYPQIAPESPGDLFDGTEIDEILALRIMTMTDAEKMEMRSSDDRARKILERTEALSMEHLMKLHGTLRELRPLKEELP